MGNTPAITPFVSADNLINCPLCDWSSENESDTRLHCYRKHDIRLRLGDGSIPIGRIDRTDIDAEVRTHLQIVAVALDTMELSLTVTDIICADASPIIMDIILKWDRRIELDFKTFAIRMIHAIALRKQLDFEESRFLDEME